MLFFGLGTRQGLVCASFGGLRRRWLPRFSWHGRWSTGIDLTVFWLRSVCALTVFRSGSRGMFSEQTA
jgi:hypothetical protein